MAYLKIFDPGQGVYDFSLKKDITIIGRKHSVADCVINDNTISRAHAQITRNNDQYIIKDLDSTSGVLVEQCRIDSFILTDGVNFQLGQIVIEFKEGEVERKLAGNIIDLSVNTVEGDYSEFPSSIGVSGRFIDAKAEEIFYSGDTMHFGKDGVKLYLPDSIVGDYDVLELEINWPGGQKRFFLTEIIAYSREKSMAFVKIHKVGVDQYVRIVKKSSQMEWMLLQVPNV